VSPRLYHDGTLLPADVQRFAAFELVELTRQGEGDAAPGLLLRNGRLALIDAASGEVYLPPAFAVGRVSRRSLLSRAVGASQHPGQRVLDAMAGWGTDGLEMISLGLRVDLVEAAPVVFELLRQRIGDAGLAPESLQCADSWETIAHGQWDAIYLDPMFPARGRKGMPKLPMQVLARIARSGGPALQDWIAHARARVRDRVVVKRRRTEAVIGRPDWQLTGRTIRFDVYRP